MEIVHETPNGHAIVFESEDHKRLDVFSLDSLNVSIVNISQDHNKFQRFAITFDGILYTENFLSSIRTSPGEYLDLKIVADEIILQYSSYVINNLQEIVLAPSQTGVYQIAVLTGNIFGDISLPPSNKEFTKIQIAYWRERGYEIICGPLSEIEIKRYKKYPPSEEERKKLEKFCKLEESPKIT